MNLKYVIFSGSCGFPTVVTVPEFVSHDSVQLNDLFGAPLKPIGAGMLALHPCWSPARIMVYGGSESLDIVATREDAKIIAAAYSDCSVFFDCGDHIIRIVAHPELFSQPDGALPSICDPANSSSAFQARTSPQTPPPCTAQQPTLICSDGSPRGTCNGES